jgi:hypothetical protein
MKYSVFWVTRNEATRRAISQRLGISLYMTVNRESDMTRRLSPEEERILMECEAMGYLLTRKKRNETDNTITPTRATPDGLREAGAHPIAPH